MTCAVEHQFSFNKQSIITKVTSQEADSKISAGKAAKIFSIHVMPDGGKGGICSIAVVNFYSEYSPGQDVFEKL